ncbi:MAG: hypothetical protein ACREDJ_02645 [Methylocella sp.]
MIRDAWSAILMAMRMLTVDQLNHIKQENRSSGCGIACIAMVARTNYDVVRKKIFGDQEKDLYLWWSDIRDALKGYGIGSDERARRVNDWQRVSQINVFSIVWCRWNSSDTIGHYVVWDPISRKVHDPLRNSAVDYSRIRRHPVSYLLVKPKAHAAI